MRDNVLIAQNAYKGIYKLIIGDREGFKIKR